MQTIFVRLLDIYRYIQNSKIKHLYMPFILFPTKMGSVGWGSDLREPIYGHIQEEGINVLELPRRRLFLTTKDLQYICTYVS